MSRARRFGPCGTGRRPHGGGGGDDEARRGRGPHERWTGDRHQGGSFTAGRGCQWRGAASEWSMSAGLGIESRAASRSFEASRTTEPWDSLPNAVTVHDADDRTLAAEAAAKRRMSMRTSVGKAAAALAAVVMLLSAVPASAQTQGMERRNERRNVRQGARAAKQECLAGDEKTRPECRQTKRSIKQNARRHGGTTSAPPENPAQ